MSTSLCSSTTRPTSPAKSRIRSSAGFVEAGRLARDLRGHELLVDRELADPGEDAGERLEHALDVVGRVHVGRVEARDHGVEARLLRGRERAVGHRDEGVGERVVVERGVRLQVVGGGEVAGVSVRPGLLQRDPEEGHAADLRAHDLQEVADVGPLLDVVREVEVHVMHLRGGRLRGLGGHEGGGAERQGQAQRGRLPRRTWPSCPFRVPCAPFHGSARPQKFSSRFVWKTSPLPPTG